MFGAEIDEEFDLRRALDPAAADAELARLVALERAEKTGSLDIRGLRISDLSQVGDLKHLKQFSCFETDVTDLSPLSNLTDLVDLNCRDTGISDLSPVSKLPALATLDCSSTRVANLGPVSSLGNLRRLRFFSTPVTDLSPLSELGRLTFLDFPFSGASDLSPISSLVALEFLGIAYCRASDLSPLAKLHALKRLNCSGLRGITVLTPLARLTNLTRLECGSTGITDLEPLANLVSLSKLDCQNTHISDLGAVRGFVGLEELSCDWTQVSDLSPLSGLFALKRLSLSGSHVADLSPLSSLSALTYLDCSDNEISDLTPISNHGGLERLICGHSQISDLSSLSCMTALERLDCDHTAVSDLSPIADLPQLVHLNISRTEVADTSSIIRLPKLESLSCGRSRIEDISELEHVPDLRILRIEELRIGTPLERILAFPALTRLYADGTRIPDVPADILSEDMADNCLPRLRAHFHDLQAGAVSVEHVKLILLGNGRVGKTQLSRSLLSHRYPGATFDETVPSTHGVRVIRDEMPVPDAGAGGTRRLKVSLWDFGGQDMYHGTHSLFLKSRAIFILCWNPEQEDRRELAVEGFTQRNQPLAYWIDYVRHLAGSESPLLIVQTQCDRDADAQEARPHALDLKDFAFRRVRHFSAKTGTGGGELRSAIAAAADWMRDTHGTALIGRGRMTVLDRLEQWRSEEADLASTDRLHKTLTQEQFEALCQEAGGISSPAHLLHFLHQAGVVFYQPTLFDDRIILDQNWALDAIYTVFDRQQCYRQLQALGGRFTADILGLLAWGDYSEAERKLFLSMMTSCGIAFQYREGDDQEAQAQYIAPELLPPKSVMMGEIQRSWHEDVETISATLHYPLLHQGLMRQVIADIGRDAGINAIYWRGGTCFYEREHGANAMIEEALDEANWSGNIRIACQRGNAAALLDQLITKVTETGARLGLTGALDRADAAPLPEPKPEQTPILAPGPFPRGGAERWFVSYAWGDDDTPEGRERSRRVNELCDEAERRGVELLRDASAMQNGDSIHKFMTSLSCGDRIIVILSEKYLKSPYCMFELYSAWRFSKADPDTFANAVRAFSLPDTKIGNDFERSKIAAYWREQRTNYEAIDRRDLSEQAFVRYKLMEDYANRVSDILDVMADRVTPADWEAFLDYAFAR